MLSPFASFRRRSPPSLVRRLSFRRQRGVTLVELLIALGMIGVLAALATVGYTRYIRRARVNYTKDIIQSIALGQSMYFASTDGYLNCSAGYTDFYPAAPDNKQRQFHDPAHAQYNCWKLLNVETDGPSYAAFTVIAGTAAEAVPAPPTTRAITFPNPTTAWYTILATTDTDADGDRGYFFASSFQPAEVFDEDTDE